GPPEPEPEAPVPEPPEVERLEPPEPELFEPDPPPPELLDPEPLPSAEDDPPDPANDSGTKTSMERSALLTWSTRVAMPHWRLRQSMCSSAALTRNVTVKVPPGPYGLAIPRP